MQGQDAENSKYLIYINWAYGNMCCHGNILNNISIDRFSKNFIHILNFNIIKFQALMSCKIIC